MNFNEQELPAFPYVIPPTKDGGFIAYYGMTLRDYFAAKAIPVFFSGMLNAAMKEKSTPTKTQWDQMAAACYGLADAMLEARK